MIAAGCSKGITRSRANHRFIAALASSMATAPAAADDWAGAEAAAGAVEEVDGDGQPHAIVIINLPDALFEENSETSSCVKDEFEKIFRRFDDNVEISYLKRFQRAKLAFTSGAVAADVKDCMNGTVFLGRTMKCYFVKNSEATKAKPLGQYLEPPTLEKQLLISPPTSPPDGWDPLYEREPAAVNLDLVAAVAQLQPGGMQELCQASPEHPGVVVQVAPQETSSNDKDDLASKHPKLKMPQTRCPAWTSDNVA